MALARLLRESDPSYDERLAAKRALLRTLGSLEAIKAASEEELARVPKISRADAALIARFFATPAAPLPIKDDSAGDDPSVNRD